MPCIPPAIKTHPLYSLRRALLLTTPLAFFFAFVAVASAPNYYASYDASPFMVHLFFATISGLLGIFELIRWGSTKNQDPDSDPRFPLKRVLIGDAILTVAFGMVFSAELEVAGSPYERSNILAAYASVVSLIALALHAVCAWKQLMALKKKHWEDERNREIRAGLDGVIAENCGQRPRTPCPKCGPKGSWFLDGHLPYEQDTPTSSQVEGGLDLASGYEIIPDKMPEVEVQPKRKKGKGLSRPNVQTPLMEV